MAGDAAGDLVVKVVQSALPTTQLFGEAGASDFVLSSAEKTVVLSTATSRQEVGGVTQGARAEGQALGGGCNVASTNSGGGNGAGLLGILLLCGVMLTRRRFANRVGL